MRSSAEFETNPIEINIDPEQVVAAWKAGADTEELHRRGCAGGVDPGTPLDLRLPAEAPDAPIEAI